MRLKAIWVLLMFVCLSAQALASQFYRWVDEEGVLHFDTEKPEGVEVSIKHVDPKAKQATTKHFASGCKTEKCQKNLEKLLGKQLPATTKIKPKATKSGPKVTKLSPKSKQDKTNSTMQRCLAHKQKNPAQKLVPAPKPTSVSSQIDIPKNYTLIAPDKNRQQKIRAQYGSNPSNGKKQKSQAVLDHLFKNRTMYFSH